MVESSLIKLTLYNTSSFRQEVTGMPLIIPMQVYMFILGMPRGTPHLMPGTYSLTPHNQLLVTGVAIEVVPSDQSDN